MTSTTLKILQISSAQSFGGGERHVLDLVNSLLAREHDLYVAVRPASPLGPRLERLPRSHVRVLPLRNALDVLSANELARFVKKNSIDIVHAHMARDYPLAAYAVARNPSARLILTRHVLFPMHRLHRAVFARAARVIAVSHAVARGLLTKQLVSPANLAVVPIGVDLSHYQRGTTSGNRRARTDDHDCENQLLVGAVGQLNSLKGHDVFLRAAATVVKSFPNARFVIAGGDTSPQRKTLLALQKLIDELDLHAYVNLPGEVEEVAQLLATLDLFVSASKTESYGLAMVEALASGVPVVATDTEGAREVIKHGETGLLVPIDDAGALTKSILELLENESLRVRMSERAYLDARDRFQLEHTVDAIEKIYRESLERTR